MSNDDPKTGTRGVSRRHLLGAGAVVAAGAVGAGSAPFGPPRAAAQTAAATTDAAPDAAVRPSVSYLWSSGQQIQSLHRGVEVMKSRPFEDPTSWSYQAAIHGYGLAPPAGMPQEMADTMNGCIHGVRGETFPHRFFLPWHRLYLHYFERILRAASGDDTLALPYWNYSDPNGRAIPLAFRWPDGAENALYDANRNRFEGTAFQPPLFINRGDPLPANRTDTRASLAEREFDRFSDTLENGLHGTVHVDIGGRGGDMSGFDTAGLDPIFWLHHCNVDRLWSRWLDTGGHANPGAQAWLDREFTFYDETGTRRTRAVSDTVDTRTLGYTYDDEPFSPFVGFEPILVASAGESAAMVEEIGKTEGISLTGKAEKIAIAPGDAQAAESAGADLFFTERDARDPRPVILRLEGIDYEGAPGYLYEIFVNMPADTPREEAGPYFAGTLSPFGLAGSVVPLDIDIGGLLNRQIEAELFLGGQVTVDFIPANVAEDAQDVAEITVESISLVRE